MEEIKNILGKIPGITLVGESVKNDLMEMLGGYGSFEVLKKDLPEFYQNGGGLVYNDQVDELYKKHPESFIAYEHVKYSRFKPVRYNFWNAYVVYSQFHIEAFVKLIEAEISGKKTPKFLSPEVFEINTFIKEIAVKDLERLYAFYLWINFITQ